MPDLQACGESVADTLVYDRMDPDGSHSTKREIASFMPESAVRAPRIATVAGIGLLAVIGAVHLLYAHGYFVFVAYVGALFYATVASVVVAAVGLVRGARVWGWTLGIVVAGATLAAYIASRTVGLPMFPVLPWQDPFGLAALGAEALFIVLGVTVLRIPGTSVKQPYHPNGSRRVAPGQPP